MAITENQIRGIEKVESIASALSKIREDKQDMAALMIIAFRDGVNVGSMMNKEQAETEEVKTA